MTKKTEVLYVRVEKKLKRRLQFEAGTYELSEAKLVRDVIAYFFRDVDEQRREALDILEGESAS